MAKGDRSTRKVNGSTIHMASFSKLARFGSMKGGGSQEKWSCRSFGGHGSIKRRMHDTSLFFSFLSFSF